MNGFVATSLRIIQNPFPGANPTLPAGSTTYTLFRNGVSAGIFLTVASNDGTVNSSFGSVSYNAGDRIAVQAVGSGTNLPNNVVASVGYQAPTVP
jgi:hypothetical protein